MGTAIPTHRNHSLKFDDPLSSIASSSSAAGNSRKKWLNLMPVVVILVVVAEIAFLGRLDMAKKADLVNSWADSFYLFTTSSWLPSSSSTHRPDANVEDGGGGGDGDDGATGSGPQNCEEWLEKADAVPYSRDFTKEPVLVTGADQEWKTCGVGCKFGGYRERKADASFGLPNGGDSGTASILRSMESAQYYGDNNVEVARRRGYNVVMTTSLSSDVPVGYFSWAEYDIMAPPEPKTESALAAAFISNCGARNFRLQALEALESANVKIDSYGSCHRNRDGRVDKVKALKHYKFSLAFENSNEEDYVTEKFFQSLVAGTVPVVVGAPNIKDFAPSPSSVLHIKELKDADSVAKTMKYLSENPSAYSETLRWKYEGPSDSFKALVDMAAVHSSCRLCIYLATKIQEKEEKNIGFQKRPCKCTRGSETIYHAYVRERGRFDTVSIFLRSSNLTLDSLESTVLSKFKSRKHGPVWKQERPEKIRGGDELKVYRVYPLGMTERQALYTFKFKDDTELRNHVVSNPCPKFEVIFV